MHPELTTIDDTSYTLTHDQVAFYREHRYIKLKDVLSADELDHYGREITRKVIELNTMHLPMNERDTYSRAFLQVMNLWRESDVVKEFVFSKRLAHIAAQLMEVDGVRLYHDQALYKEPAGGYTPWHADQYYWPLASDKTVTAWIPLQATPLEMGPLEFSAASHELSAGRGLGISDESEAAIDTLLEQAGFEHVVEPFELGEVSFHAGWLYHRAGPNSTDQARRVMCIIYMDEQMKLKAPENENQQNDWDTWCPGADVGEVIDTPLNPVIYTS
ncbi:MAG: phytanoyl-CoA dioxygenase family protein [Rhodothermales bacterium]|nr:phytanoyl-CoA dioxygenase family protein [Rhodothermales bacterium]MBO6778086.1 phytanoyl-CoA dioxygenase family protein [Rhodothermales bacterium]